MSARLVKVVELLERGSREVKLVKVVELLPRGCIAVVECSTTSSDGRALLFVAVCSGGRYIATFDGRRIYLYLCACDGEKAGSVETCG